LFIADIIPPTLNPCLLIHLLSRMIVWLKNSFGWRRPKILRPDLYISVHLSSFPFTPGNHRHTSGREYMRYGLVVGFVGMKSWYRCRYSARIVNSCHNQRSYSDMYVFCLRFFDLLPDLIFQRINGQRCPKIRR